MTWKPRLIQGGRSLAVHPSVNTGTPEVLELVRPPGAQTLTICSDTGAPRLSAVADVAEQDLATPAHPQRGEAEVPIIATILGLGMFP